MFQNIIDNGVSRINVVAFKKIEIEDIDKTEAKKRYESLKVKPVLKPIQDDINNNMRKKLGAELDSIRQIRELQANSSEKRNKIKNLFNIDDQDYFINHTIDYLYMCSDAEFSKLAVNALAVLNDALKEGIIEADLIDNKDEILEKHIPASFLRTQSLAVAFLLNNILEPNMKEDQTATELAIQKVLSEISPVMVVYEKGSIVVSAGERVKETQKKALKQLGYNVNQLDLIGIMGILSLVGLCLFTTIYYLRNFADKFLKIPYTALMALLTIVISIFAVSLPQTISVYVVPIPAIAILLTIFTSSRVALLITMLILIMIGISLQYSVEYIFVFMLGAIIAIFTTNSVNYYRRMDMVRAGFDVGLIQMFVALVMFLLQNNTENLDIGVMVMKMFLGFGNGLLSGIIALGILPLIESLFKIITPYGLAELADHNQALLRRLQFEAPGTYHHSLMVSNLCEAAAEAIDANPILARVAAFYHDIGKLKRPLFFIENQSYFGIENPHENLTSRLSKMVITAHPKDGVELAKEYGLPSIIHQFIIQHHGDSLVAYFYKQAIEAEGAENIQEEQFRYSCPRPSTKEAAILMLADAVESAVRTLKNAEPEVVDEMIDKLIRERLIDNQLSESPLTQKDLKTVAGVFKRALRGMQHHRIKYHEDILEELNKKSINGIKQAQLQSEIDIKVAKLRENAQKHSDSGSGHDIN
ncbi:MAG TPA: HDIG domain-containing protein [Candidatus Gastranaerophilales bacterium]|nr:HDIG domain-containing protein [Candidatus Gastranaerophilales bacterium]